MLYDYIYNFLSGEKLVASIRLRKMCTQRIVIPSLRIWGNMHEQDMNDTIRCRNFLTDSVIEPLDAIVNGDSSYERVLFEITDSWTGLKMLLIINAKDKTIEIIPKGYSTTFKLSYFCITKINYNEENKER